MYTNSWTGFESDDYEQMIENCRENVDENEIRETMEEYDIIKFFDELSEDFQMEIVDKAIERMMADYVEEYDEEEEEYED